MLGFGQTPEVEPDPEPEGTTSFDGGARQPAPLPPEPHGQWLGRVLRGEVPPGPPPE
jgi:hypothetical protein